MIKFMVLAAPRSGTTWVANWLTTERTLCLHDPMLQFSEDELDSIPCDRDLGLSCTALPLLLDWVNQHPAKKLILHRDREEIDTSLLSIGLTPLTRVWDGKLEQITGLHVGWREIFSPDSARRIFESLTGYPFDAPRHEQLCQMHVEPEFDRVHVKADRARGFATKIRQAIAGLS